MKRLAIIPARGGSKGIPRKNLRYLNGQTLVERAIKTAQKSTLFDYILVSTDDHEISSHARSLGAQVPFLRSAITSSDTASSESMIEEVITKLIDHNLNFDTVALLEPSSPFRTCSMIDESIFFTESTLYDSSLTLTQVPIKYNYFKQLDVNDSGIVSSVSNANSSTSALPRQLLTPTYIRNGLVYSFRADMFLNTKSIIGSRAKAIIVETPHVNIDTLHDLEIAHKYFEDGFVDA